MNKQEFIEAAERDLTLLNTYKEVEVDDMYGHHTAIQFDGCDEVFWYFELIEAFGSKMPLAEQMYQAAARMAAEAEYHVRFYNSVDWGERREAMRTRLEAIKREKIEAEQREREYKACLKRYEGYEEDE